MEDFRNIKVWEYSHKLVIEIYSLTLKFPKDEIYGLVNQIRRSSVSIPTNIAEGCGRGSDSDFKRFLQIAFGSACELEYLLLLSNELQFVSTKDYDQIIPKLVEVKKMLSGFIKKLKTDSR